MILYGIARFLSARIRRFAVRICSAEQ